MTSRVFGRVKPALVCEQEVSARSTDSRENHDRRALQLSRQGCLGAPRRPSGSLSRLSHPKSRPVNMGQQRMGTATTDDPPKIVDQPINSYPPDSTGGSKSLPVSRTQAGKRADIVSLRKHLGHARRLASAIKRGQSYFHLLQKEEREEQEVEESQQMRKEEQLRREPRPPRFSSDSDSESEGWPVPAGTSWSSANEARLRRRKSQSARPFTPVHHSLISPLLSEAPRKVIYRQLCCLNWLLEALTLDPSGRVGPLAACWDPKDPGRGRTMIKTLKKERAIENKWEQFVSTKPQRVHRRHPRSSSARLHTHRKSSFASVASLSAFTSTTVGSSVSSLVPGTEEGTECPAAAEETEQPPSECLRTLSDVHQKVKKKNQSSRHTESLTIPESKTQPLPQRTDNQSSSKTTMSCPAKPPLAISHLINNRATMLRDVKAVFDERVEELAQSYIDALELKARLSTLLSSLPEKVYRERAVSRVLEKLSGFAEQQTLRVRPQLFLKVLGGLEPWELCLPEMCVAIQIATKHVVQMSREQYDAWLRSRVTLPPQYPMPLKHQVNHTHQDLEEGYRHRQLD
ncbi:coiled-coil domain-containing protein 60-like isoform X3 [Morone saxatilis]|uniref:coiled-coil domain-containing protein 60-like isoform X3 n=1 Tax=Morone saxatilis TaxID=34816 RepID=UPI0015E1D0E7|nr:coiled-coil domain-containing protein 60-like isoform X3 [Morone saxatilis]